LFLLAILYVPSSFAQEPFLSEVRVELRGGDRLSGTMLEENDEAITLRTHFGAEIEIPQEEILRIAWDEADDPTAEATAEPVPEEDEDEIDITGELELGAAIVASATNRRDFLSQLDLTFRRGADHLQLQGVIDIQKAADVTLRDRRGAAIRFQKELTAPWFTNVSARYLRDPTTGLSRRTTASAQFGRAIFDNELHSLTLRAGPGFADEHRTDGTDWRTPLIGWGVSYELNFTGFLDRFSFRHEQEGSVDPRGKPLRLLLDSETALRYRVTDNLFIAVTGTVEVDSLSPDESTTFDRRVGLRLGYGW